MDPSYLQAMGQSLFCWVSFTPSRTMKVLMTRICIYDDLCFTRLTFFLALHPRLCLVES